MERNFKESRVMVELEEHFWRCGCKCGTRYVIAIFYYYKPVQKGGTAGRKLVKQFFPEKAAQWAVAVEEHKNNLLNYIIFLRVTPFLPNWFINMSAPVIGVPLVPFALGTFIGVAPPSFVAIQAGQTLHTLTSTSDACEFKSGCDHLFDKLREARLATAIVETNIDTDKKVTGTVQHTKLCRSELVANDILPKYYDPRPFLLRRVPILRRCDDFVTNFTAAKFRPSYDLTSIKKYTKNLSRLADHPGGAVCAIWRCETTRSTVLYVQNCVVTCATLRTTALSVSANIILRSLDPKPSTPGQCKVFITNAVTVSATSTLRTLQGTRPMASFKVYKNSLVKLPWHEPGPFA
ncbi:Transmembrane protein 41 homolog [Eumeta japonica]|uniref:Transmembrane protein 41 homolog n=1 Tax=Eumeta variegata TaxID=151549 RepID=A0A4C1X1T1_EUMVA|nr:Transmembrane protein 41 homolog [Eumeta japonica]